MYKKMTALHSQRNAQTSRMEEMEAEMAQVHLELSELQTQCEDKDAQVCQMSMNISSHFNCNQNLVYIHTLFLAFQDVKFSFQPYECYHPNKWVDTAKHKNRTE